MGQLDVSDQPKLLNELVESLGQAVGAASQIIHLHQDPRWMMVREALELAREGVMSVATFEARKVTIVKP